VDDDADQAKLAIMHYEACQASAANGAPPDLVRKIYEYSGTLESFRKYQNNVIFLVADTDQVASLVSGRAAIWRSGASSAIQSA